MRFVVRMALMALSLLLLICSAQFALFNPSPVEASDITALSRKWPLVFGFEFTMDGIVTSASLPNGTTLPIGVTQGSTAYRAEMARLYSICEDTARTSRLPAIAKEYYSEETSRTDKGTDYPYRWIGSPVTDLKDAVIEAKRATFRTLAEQHGLADLSVHDEYHALATAPQFIFTAMKPTFVKVPFATWELRVPEHGQDLHEHLRAKQWLKIMVTQFSQAVVEAGFHRCSIPYNFPWRTDLVPSSWGYYPDEAFPHIGYANTYDEYQFMQPASTHAICAASIGECYLDFWGSAQFRKTGLEPCQLPNTVAVVADLQSTGLSLWAEGIKGCHLDSVHWNTWLELGPPSKNKVTAWSESVQSRIAGLLRDTASKANTDEEVTLIPTGNAWSSELLDTLRNTSNLTIHEIPEPIFAASMNAADFARWEERSLANECGRPDNRNEQDFLGPGYTRSWSWGEDDLWPVERSHCMNDEDCEKLCKWRGAPSCFADIDLCQCGELYETIPGARIGEFDQRMQEMEWEAKERVFQRMSGMCKPQPQDTCNSASARRWWKCRHCEEDHWTYFKISRDPRHW